MSAVFSTPSFLKALAPLAKENQVSNKVYKAKLAAKAKRVKEIEQTRKIADKMDKELTKLEKIAEKEAVKQAKIAAKEAKKANVVSKEEKIAAKAAAKEAAKQEKIAAKAAAKEAAKVVVVEQPKEVVVVEEVVVEQPKEAVKKAAKKQTKKQPKQETIDRVDIIRTICEKLGNNESTAVEMTA